jgi:hypothetical protein
MPRATYSCNEMLLQCRVGSSLERNFAATLMRELQFNDNDA